MALFTKKEKKPLEPEFLLSPTNIPTLNYSVYYMKPVEKIIYFVLAFLVGAIVGYEFYGGIGKNEFNQPTMITYILNISIPSILGILAGRFFIPVRTAQIINKRYKNLKLQFRDLLEALSTSLGAGKNVIDSFASAYDDLKVQYPPDAYIIKEVEIILDAVQNNVNIEEVLLDFGNRSKNDDIVSFGNTFAVCYRKGGNIKDVIRNTHQIISEKMEVEQEIETIITSNKTEQNIMVAMPIALIGMIKSLSPEFGRNFTTPAGIISTTIAVAVFIAAYFIGKEILSIKV